MEDILPQDVGIWQWLERVARVELESHGYREIRTPILEDTALFTRTIGEGTDIVSKEMFTMTDRKSRSLSMRPEGTAPIARSYIEHSIGVALPEGRLYYIGPMFRSERPQKGRSRQFHQIGIELIGTKSPYADCEVILQMDRMLRKFGLDNFVIKLNSLGCKKDKIEYSRKLGEYLKGEKAALCEDCGQRIKKNVLRVLDCKKESCAAVLRDAPDIAASLCPSCTSSLDTVKDVLKKLGIDYRQTKNLVRGLDYYTGTVFEVTHPALGAQDALGAGGRYDNLVSELGGPDTGAVGYAIGMERLIIALGDKKISGPQPRVVYLATLGNEAKVEGLRLSEEIRDSINGRDKVNVIVLVDSDESSLKSQMRQADKNGAALVIIIGEDELRQGKVVIRDMATKEQSLIDKGAVAGEIRKKLC
jgi:histidyl-tRNA synthetase